MSNNNNKVKIFDTTLRDGEQSPGFSMNKSQKIKMAMQLDLLGVDVIEAGFPASSIGDFEAIVEVAKVVQNSEVCGLSRAVKSDIITCWEAVKNAKKPRIHTFIATSELHMTHKLNKTPEQVLTMAVEAVKLAKSLCDRVTFSAEDGFRSDKDFVCRVFEAVIEAGADTVDIPDTVGYATPEEFGQLVQYIIKNTKNIDQVIVATHCHDDLGMAVANSLFGIKNGAREVQCTINGIGERAGNASLEEVVMAIKTRPDFFGDVHTTINTKQIYSTSRLLVEITGMEVQANKSIVGANAFAHEAGIHQDGMLKNRTTYEIMTPESVGVQSSSLVLGKHSGSNAVFSKLTNLGITISESQKLEFFNKFKNLADQNGVVLDDDLRAIYNQFLCN